MVIRSDVVCGNCHDNISDELYDNGIRDAYTLSDVDRMAMENGADMADHICSVSEGDAEACACACQNI